MLVTAIGGVLRKRFDLRPKRTSEPRRASRHGSQEVIFLLQRNIFGIYLIYYIAKVAIFFETLQRRAKKNAEPDGFRICLNWCKCYSARGVTLT